MKKEFLKFGVIFLITIAVVFWGLNFIFLNFFNLASNFSLRKYKADPKKTTITSRIIESASKVKPSFIFCVTPIHDITLSY